MAQIADGSHVGDAADKAAKGGGTGGIGGGSGNAGNYGIGGSAGINTGSFTGGLHGDGGGGKSGGVTEKAPTQTQTFSASPQNNVTPNVTPTFQLPPPPPLISPQTPSSGQAPNGSGIIGFPSDGYFSGDAETLSVLDLAELLQLANNNYGDPVKGDIGERYVDDNDLFQAFIGRAKDTARSPLALIAAAGLLGIVALKLTAKAA